MEALLSSHSVYAKIDVADRSKLFAEFIEKLVQKKKVRTPETKRARGGRDR